MYVYCFDKFLFYTLESRLHPVNVLLGDKKEIGYQQINSLIKKIFLKIQFTVLHSLNICLVYPVLRPETQWT